MKNTSQNPIDVHKPSSIKKMFDAIAPKYDLMNHLMSFGMDILWRKKAISFLSEKNGGRILDIAAGSGDVAIEISKKYPAKIVTADFSLNMLSVLKHKLESHIPDPKISTVCCNALSLPFNNEVFDGTIVAFGIRNFADRLFSLQEMQRVLKPNGVSIILELTAPKSSLISQLYTFYTRNILPVLGKYISKHLSAYSYLPESIVNFPDAREFQSLMQLAGFADTKIIRLTFGVATIFIGQKL